MTPKYFDKNNICFAHTLHTHIPITYLYFDLMGLLKAYLATGKDNLLDYFSNIRRIFLDQAHIFTQSMICSSTSTCHYNFCNFNPYKFYIIQPVNIPTFRIQIVES